MIYPSRDPGSPLTLQPQPLVSALRAALFGLSLSSAMPAYAQADQPQVQVQQYNIPAGSLDRALEQFARTAGVNLNYNPELLNGKQTGGLQGSYGSDQVLQMLLRDSGLEALPFEGGYSLRAIEKAALQVFDTINVYGRKADDQIGNIPQAVTVLDQESLTAGSADTVGDALSILAGGSRSGTSLDMFSDNFLIRGFAAQQASNGLSFRRVDHPTDLANVERIEVLKGPSSVLYGQMEPGGTINLVTKQPLDHFYAAAGVELGSYNQKRTTLDITGPVNDRVRARLNLALQDGDSSIDHLGYKRTFIAPNVTVDLTETTNITIEGSYSANEWDAVHGGAPLEGALTANPNGDYSESFNTSGPDSYTDRDSKELNIRLTEALSDQLDLRFSYSYTHNQADWAEYVNFGLDTDDMRTLNRVVFAGRDTYKKDHDFIVDLTGELETGSISHSFVAGLNYRESDLERPNQLHRAPGIDLYNPQYGTLTLNSTTLIRDRNLIQDDKILAGFIQDRMTISPELQLLAGLRYTDSEQSQVLIDKRRNSRSEDAISQTNWSSQLGAVYTLNDQLSVYANRSEAFVPQQGTTAGLKPLEAEQSTQYEAGIRLTLDELQVGLAGFNIRKDNIAISDPLNDDFEVARGAARSRGVELSVQGYVTPNWYLQGAYGYTDTRILNSDEAELEGNRFANVPLHTASLHSRYDLISIPQLSVGGTALYVGDRYGDDGNSFTLPGYVRLDLAAHYAINEQLKVDLLIDNALNRKIYAVGAFDGVVREPGRTYMARLKYQF